MAHIVANLPPVNCYIRKEFLYDFEKGHGELVPNRFQPAPCVLPVYNQIHRYRPTKPDSPNQIAHQAL